MTDGAKNNFMTIVGEKFEIEKFFDFFGKRQILLFWPLNPDNLMKKKKIEISKKNSVGSTKDGKVFFLTANYIFGYCWVTDGAKNNFMTIVGEKFESE